MRTEQFNRTIEVFKAFLKFGCFTFGGGWSIIAQIQKEFVEKRHWITDEELLDFASVGRSTPGLMIGNACVLFGHRVAGIPGALAALLGVVIPPIAIMLGVVFIYDLIKDNVYVARAMIGVRAAVVPIIFNALVRMFKSGMKNLYCYLIAIGAAVLCLLTKVNNVLIVLMGAAAGLLYQEVKSRHDLS